MDPCYIKSKSDVKYLKAYLIFICFPGTLIEAASNSSNVCKCELDVCGPHFVKLFWLKWHVINGEDEDIVPSKFILIMVRKVFLWQMDIYPHK